MYEVVVEDVFSAAHRLKLPSGEYEPLHGHNWPVRVTYRGAELDDMGVLVDFTVVRPALRAVLSELHDTCLNDHPAFADGRTSAERVAAWIAEKLAGAADGEVLFSVEVGEEPGCFARYLRRA